MNTDLANESVMFACWYECFCNNGLDDVQNQPVNRVLFAGLTVVGQHWSYDMRLVEVITLTERAQKLSPSRYGLDPGLRLPLKSQDREDNDLRP